MRYGRILLDETVETPEANTVNMFIKPSELVAGVDDEPGSAPLYARTATGQIFLLGGSSAYLKEGYSARFAEQVNVAKIEEALDQIFKFSYVAPTAALAVTNQGNNLIGSVVEDVTYTATITKRSQPIVAVRFFSANVLIHTEDYSSAPQTGNFVVEHTAEGLNIAANTALKIEVEDTVGGITTTTQNINFLNWTGSFQLTSATVVPFFTAATDADKSVYLNGFIDANPARAALRSSRLIPTETFDAIASEYFVYFIWRSTYGNAIPPVSFVINGLPNTGFISEQFQYTNQEGTVETFVIFRTATALNSSFTFDVN